MYYFIPILIEFNFPHSKKSNFLETSWASPCFSSKSRLDDCFIYLLRAHFKLIASTGKNLPPSDKYNDCLTKNFCPCLFVVKNNPLKEEGLFSFKGSFLSNALCIWDSFTFYVVAVLTGTICGLKLSG